MNSNVATMDSTPVIIDGRTLAPARYVALGFGGTTQWDALNRVVVITGVTTPTVETTTEMTTTTTVTTTETTTEITTVAPVVVSSNEPSDELMNPNHER